MKKYLFSLLFSIVGIAAFSQSDSARANKFLPGTGDFGFSIVVDGLIDNINIGPKENEFGNNILFLRYYSSSDLAYRMGFGVDINNFKRSTADSVGQELRERDTTISDFSLNVSFGLEKHLRPNKRLDPYLAADLGLIFIGKSVQKNEEYMIGAAGTSSVVQTIKQDGGLGASLTGSFGFNYFLAPKLSIGSELGLGVSIIRRGGAKTDNTIISPVNGTATSVYVVSSDKTTNINMGMTPSASIHLSYFF